MHVSKITIAVNRVAEMVQFYNEALGAKLLPTPVNDYTFFKGKLGNLDLMFCPNELLQIEAEKNNIQFTVIVEDIRETLRRAEMHGGSMMGDLQDTPDHLVCVVADPDHNTIELIQIKEA